MLKSLIYFFFSFLLPVTLLGQTPRCLTDELRLNPEFFAQEVRYQTSYESYLTQSHSQRWSNYFRP